MAAGAPAAFQSENTRVRPPIIDVFHVRSSSTARHMKFNSRQTRRGSTSPQSAHTSSYIWYVIVPAQVKQYQKFITSQLVPKFISGNVDFLIRAFIVCRILLSFMVSMFIQKNGDRLSVLI